MSDMERRKTVEGFPLFEEALEWSVARVNLDVCVCVSVCVSVGVCVCCV